MGKRNKQSLNTISHNSAIGMIEKVINNLKINVQEIYIDTVGDPQKYQDLLVQIFPSVGKIVVSKKADSLFPIVSAASIIAKVTRDRELENWRFDEDKQRQKQAEIPLYEVSEEEVDYDENIDEEENKNKNKNKNRKVKRQKKDDANIDININDSVLGKRKTISRNFGSGCT